MADKPKPTLYEIMKAKMRMQDKIPVASSAMLYRLNDEFPHFKNCVPFMLDEAAVKAALEMRSTIFIEGKRGLALPDLARVPFQHTWLEYDPAPKVPDFDPELTSGRVGHMIERHENFYRIVTFENARTDPDIVIAMPYIPMISSDGSDLAWHHFIPSFKANGTLQDEAPYVKEISNDLGDLIRGLLLTGHANVLPSWGRRVGGQCFTESSEDFKTADKLAHDFYDVLVQSKATISLLMTMLSLIAWCPVELVKRKPTGMWLHRRKPRAFIEHTTVTIKVPIRVAYKHLKKNYKEEIHRRRRHMCREHLRVYHPGKPNEKIVYIREHPRGDATLGWVHHDYKVTGRRVHD